MTVLELWLPILLAGVACHVASTLAWTVLPHHKPEYRGAGDKEGALMDWVAQSGLAPGNYVFPHCQDMQEARSEDYARRQGKCVGMLSIWPGPVNMSRAIVQTLVFFLVAAFVIGYVASIGLPEGAQRSDVFRLVFTVGVLTHCFAKFPHVFWFPTRYAMSVVDGVVYAALTAGVFTLLWPTG